SRATQLAPTRHAGADPELRTAPPPGLDGQHDLRRVLCRLAGAGRGRVPVEGRGVAPGGRPRRVGSGLSASELVLTPDPDFGYGKGGRLASRPHPHLLRGEFVASPATTRSPAGP